MTDALEEYRRLLQSLPSGVGGSIELVLGQMRPSNAHMLRLSAIPHQFDTNILQIMNPSLLSSDAESLCWEFADLSFVAPFNGMFHVHDEARGYLFRWWLNPARAAEFRATSRRLAEYYTERERHLTGARQTSARLQGIFHRIGADEAAGFAQFEALCRSERYSYRLHTCETMLNLIHEYRPVLDGDRRRWLDYHEAKLFIDVGRYEEAKKLLGMLESDATDDRLHARVLYRLGCIHNEEQAWTTAIEWFRSGLAFISSHQEVADQEMKMLQGVATAYRESGRPEDAEWALRRSITLAEAAADRSALATGYNGLGNLYRKLGQSRRAIAAFEKSLQYLTEGHETFRPSQVYNNMGLIHSDRAEWGDARKCLEKSLEMSQSAGDTRGQAVALSNLGRVYLNLARQSDAIAAAERAVELFLNIHQWSSAAVTTRSLGRYYRRIDRRSEASASLTRAAQLFRQAGTEAEAAEVETELADLGTHQGLPWYAWAVVVVAVLIFVIAILVGVAGNGDKPSAAHFKAFHDAAD